MRALLFLLFIIGLFFLVRAIINRTDQLREDASVKKAQKKQAEPMVTCEVCQLHLPETEALCVADAKGQKHCFCSKEHLQIFIDKGGKVE